MSNENPPGTPEQSAALNLACQTSGALHETGTLNSVRFTFEDTKRRMPPNLVCEVCEARAGSFVAYVEKLADVIALTKHNDEREQDRHW